MVAELEMICSIIVNKTYCLDESGDVGLFARKGRSILNKPNVPRFFMLGMIDAFDPIGLNTAMLDLRQQIWGEITADTRFASDIDYAKRHAHLKEYFHAKDDPPWVRGRVFDLIANQPFRFSAVVIEKAEYLKAVKNRIATDPAYRYTSNEEYDYLVRLLLRARVHSHVSYTVLFAKRHGDRSEQLNRALIGFRNEMLTRRNKKDDGYMFVTACPEAKEHGGLQVVDYCLWALQRLYNQKEAQYFEQIWPKVTLINDRHVPGKGDCHFRHKGPSGLMALKAARGT
jgi:hypothetical protein